MKHQFPSKISLLEKLDGGFLKLQLNKETGSRWGYEEVSKWLAGEDVGYGAETRYKMPYKFNKNEYYTLKELFAAFNLSEEKKQMALMHLSKGYIIKWLENEQDFDTAVEIKTIMAGHKNDEQGALLKLIKMYVPETKAKDKSVAEVQPAHEPRSNNNTGNETKLSGRYPHEILSRPFQAYQGDEPYIFVAYAHRDSAKVYPELQRLHELGCRIWYDEGIELGVDWPNAVANAIEKCSYFIAFITPNSVESKNFRRELNLALNENKHFLPLYLEETELKFVLKLQISSFASLLKYNETPESYVKKLTQIIPSEVIESSLNKEISVNLGGGVAIELVWVLPGTFKMGSPEREKDRSNDEKLHTVTITKGYWLGKYPVTQVQWKKVMGNKLSHFKKGDDYPVIVLWDDCQEFINKLNDLVKKTNALPQKSGAFRLPTEAEWEYACRAGTQTRFYWGDDLDEKEIGDYCWYIANSNGSIHPVGQKKPNKFGLYDMSGNVCEWCSDWYGDYPADAVTDPVGPDSGSYRVLRGGGWDGHPRSCLSAIRYYYNPSGRYNYVGFRLALPSGHQG